MQATLVMFTSDGSPRSFPVNGRAVIGRKRTSDLRIPLPMVSREHCELIVDESRGELRLRDLASSNGTFHNGRSVKEAVLRPGDELRVGPVAFRVVIDGQPAEPEPVHTPLEPPRSEAAGATGEERSGDADDDAPLRLDEIEHELDRRR